MEQNKNQSSQNLQSGNMQSNNQTSGSQNSKGNNSDISNQKMQHRSDVTGDTAQNGNSNPQDGNDWSNYRNRSLSSNAEQQQNK